MSAPEYRIAANAHGIANYLNIEFGAAWQVAQCNAKVRYSTEDEARKTAERWGQRVYRCPICDGYHCSSNEQGKEEGRD